MSMLNRRLSSLHHHQRTVSQPSAGTVGVHLQERRIAALFQIHGADDKTYHAIGAKLNPHSEIRSGGASASAAHILMGNGPGAWLLVATTEPAASLLARIKSVVAGTDTTLTDLSHARTVLRLSGTNVLDVLAKGIPIDIETMIAGDSAATLFTHFNIHLYCCNRGCFDLYVYRSFGGALFAALQNAALEFGFEATTASRSSS